MYRSGHVTAILFFPCLFFFFNDPATTEIYTLSLHDALPISAGGRHRLRVRPRWSPGGGYASISGRSEEHTSELRSHVNLVCRLLLEKKNGAAEWAVEGGLHMGGGWGRVRTPQP